MKKSSKKHVTELDNFHSDSRAYSEGENYFTYHILEHMFLSDQDENTQNENELEMKGFLFESSKVTISVAMVLICHTVFTFHCQVLHYPIFCGSYT